MTVENDWHHAGTRFDDMHRAKTMNAPGSPTADEVYALSAHMLGWGGVAPTDTLLNPTTFRDFRVTNVNGFTDNPRWPGKP